MSLKSRTWLRRALFGASLLVCAGAVFVATVIAIALHALKPSPDEWRTTVHIGPWTRELSMPGLIRWAAPSAMFAPSSVMVAAWPSGRLHEPPGWQDPVGSCTVRFDQFSLAFGFLRRSSADSPSSSPVIAEQPMTVARTPNTPEARSPSEK